MNLDRWIEFVNRIMGRHLPPEQPHTGRVCVKCREAIGRNDKWHLIAASHDDCAYPKGNAPLPGKLARYIEEGL